MKRRNVQTQNLKSLCLYFIRRSYFVWKYFRSDKVKTQNGNIYSRQQIKKQMDEYVVTQTNEYCANPGVNFGELSHPQQGEHGYTHRYQ